VRPILQTSTRSPLFLQNRVQIDAAGATTETLHYFYETLTQSGVDQTSQISAIWSRRYEIGEQLLPSGVTTSPMLVLSTGRTWRTWRAL
jgi:hypothetical protein